MDRRARRSTSRAAARSRTSATGSRPGADGRERHRLRGVDRRRRRAPRPKGLDQAKRDMDMVRADRRQAHRRAAGRRAPTRRASTCCAAAERYRALLRARRRRSGSCRRWRSGASRRSLDRLGEAALVAMESGHPEACILPDVYHLHKGGSDFGGLTLLSGARHPRLPRERLPRRAAARQDHRRPPRLPRRRRRPARGPPPRPARHRASAGCLSLELFNRDYWKQDPLTVAKTGLEKTRAVVEKSLG